MERLVSGIVRESDCFDSIGMVLGVVIALISPTAAMAVSILGNYLLELLKQLLPFLTSWFWFQQPLLPKR